MDLQKIKSLIDAMATSSLAEMQFSEGEWSLRLVRRTQDAESTEPLTSKAPVRPGRKIETADASQSQGSVSRVVAPLFGMVYLRPNSEAPEFVTPGQHVASGTTVCVIEAMKVFHEVRAVRDGTIAAILVTCGQEVEAGQELMRFA
jgi:acetyl-CoA carboxylase biotin carboxyl carrier protein